MPLAKKKVQDKKSGLEIYNAQHDTGFEVALFSFLDPRAITNFSELRN